MTQDSSHRPTRRGARAGRNRPELVTSMQEVKSSPPVLETSESSEETTATPAEMPVAPPAQKRRLANFFSTVGRGEKTATEQETEAAQARIARATRGKASTPAKESREPEPPAPAKASTPARPAPARPASAFKTKYLLGMLIYLFGAQFIGSYERGFLIQNHLNSVITKFPLFGGTVVIDTSTLIFLATLVLLLIVLARFDLIPRNLGALSGQQPSQTRRGSANTGETSEGNVKNPPPTMKQGVKGADDDLYQEYRANQRRTRKR
jgi:hypothetical protein